MTSKTKTRIEAPRGRLYTRHRWSTPYGARRDAVRTLMPDDCFSLCRDRAGYYWLDCADAVLYNAEIERYTIVAMYDGAQRSERT